MITRLKRRIWGHLAGLACPGGGDGVTRRGLRTSAHATRQLSLSTYSNSLVQQFFTPGAILPPPPRDNGQRLETSVVAPA